MSGGNIIMSILKNPGLYQQGLDKMNWAFEYMPVLKSMYDEFSVTKPLEGFNIALSIHLEAKTANLARTFKAAGARVFVTGSNPLSTQDDIVAGLYHEGFDVFAEHGVDEVIYKKHLMHTLECYPDILIDDGGDLLTLLHNECKDFAKNMLGGCEETTTGIRRIRARDQAGKLDFPMIAVNDARCKSLFDNRYGTGQSVWNAIMNTTNLLIAGKTVIVAGYGWCGRGVALRALGLGAHVIVTEVDPVKGLEATMDGCRVMTMDEAAPLGDIFVTVTGCNDVVGERHFAVMKDGAILTNAGHFDVEVNVAKLREIARETFVARKNIKTYVMEDKRRLNVIGEGRLVNLAAGDGHPVEIMDLSFAIQAQGALYIAKHAKELKKKLYNIPTELDDNVAKIKLESLGIAIDELTSEQQAYLNGWEG